MGEGWELSLDDPEMAWKVVLRHGKRGKSHGNGKLVKSDDDSWLNNINRASNTCHHSEPHGESENGHQALFQSTFCSWNCLGL